MPAIVRYSPWSMFRGIQEDVNQFFNHKTEKGLENWAPHVDVTEEKDKYRIIADLPGVNPKDIKLNINDNVLTIQGEKLSESKKEQEGYSRIERFSGNFMRQFNLPDSIDVKNIQAKTKHGVLELILPKKESGTSNAIEIKVEEEK